MKRRAILLAALFAFGATAHADFSFLVHNDTSSPVQGFYLSESTDTGWGDNICSERIDPGETMIVTHFGNNLVPYDIRVVYAGPKPDASFRNLDLSDTGSIVFSDDGQGGTRMNRVSTQAVLNGMQAWFLMTGGGGGMVGGGGGFGGGFPGGGSSLCSACMGTGVCQGCKGRGTLTFGYAGTGPTTCGLCSGMGKCNSCAGTGRK